MTQDHVNQLVAWIGSHEKDLADHASALIRIPSVSGNEGPLAESINAWFEARGIESELRTIPEEFIISLPDFAGEKDLELRPNVFARLKGSACGSQRSIVVNGHLDVVPVGDLAKWRFAPFAGEQQEGRIWGRGSADMKGPIAAALMAVWALKECGFPLRRDICVQLVIGEETGGIGTLFALSDQPHPAAAIVLEPSHCRVVAAGAGSVQFTVRAVGKAAHACAPWEGRSALTSLLKCLALLNEYAAERNAERSHPLFSDYPQQAPFSIGTFSAGEWRATVPESGEFSGRLGILPGEKIDDIREAIEQQVERCRAELQLQPHELSLHWPNRGFPAWETPQDTGVIAALKSAASLFEKNDEAIGVMYGSDAGHFACVGIPVAIFGPGDIAVAHMVNEYIPQASLIEAVKILAVTLLELSTRSDNNG